MNTTGIKQVEQEYKHTIQYTLMYKHNDVQMYTVVSH